MARICELIEREPSIIEAGIILIDRDLVIPSVCEIDFVGLSEKRISFISIFESLTANHMGKAAAVKRWAEENSEVLKREYAYRGLSVPDKKSILFLCSQIDPLAIPLIPLLNNLPLEVLRYRCLESGDAKWLAIERIIGEEDLKYEVGLPRRTGDDEKPKRKIERFKAAELTEEEINEFFQIEKPRPPAALARLHVPESEEILDFEGPYFTQS
jgi:hypothetical protein